MAILRSRAWMSDKVGLEYSFKKSDSLTYCFRIFTKRCKTLCLNTDTLSAKGKGVEGQKKECNQQEDFVLKNKKNSTCLLIFRDFHFQFLFKQSMLITFSKCSHVNFLRKALDSREKMISRKTQVSANYTIASKLMICRTPEYYLNFFNLARYM